MVFNLALYMGSLLERGLGQRECLRVVNINVFSGRFAWLFWTLSTYLGRLSRNRAIPGVGLVNHAHQADD